MVELMDFIHRCRIIIIIIIIHLYSAFSTRFKGAEVRIMTNNPAVMMFWRERLNGLTINIFPYSLHCKKI